MLSSTRTRILKSGNLIYRLQFKIEKCRFIRVVESKAYNKTSPARRYKRCDCIYYIINKMIYIVTTQSYFY